MNGLMKEGMREIGKRIKCMGLGCSHGQMGESMRGSILRIRRRYKVFLFGLTIVDTGCVFFKRGYLQGF